MSNNAKTQPKKSSLVDLSEEEVASVNTTEVASETISAAKEIPASYVQPEKMVTVRGILNHKCRIGDSDIIIEKGKETKMSAGQAMILQSAGKLFIIA